MTIYDIAKNARKAAISLAAIDGVTKNKALEAIASGLLSRAQEIEEANALDLKNAREEQLDMPLLKRLAFDKQKVNDVVMGIKSLCQLEEPVGKIQMQTELDEGLLLTRIAAPIGVIGVIFESRPDALVQIASLCLKSGNAVLLKGGSEAAHTNKMLYTIIKQATEEAGS